MEQTIENLFETIKLMQSQIDMMQEKIDEYEGGQTTPEQYRQKSECLQIIIASLRLNIKSMAAKIDELLTENKTLRDLISERDSIIMKQTEELLRNEQIKIQEAKESEERETRMKNTRAWEIGMAP